MTNKGERSGMKALDFNLARNLEFDFEHGQALFKDSRYVIFDSNAIGLLRQNLIDELGEEKARNFFLRFGFEHGYSDFMQVKINYDFDDEKELLASGPVIHTWEGIVKAVPNEMRIDREKGEFFFTGTWINSYEAQQHLSFNPTSKKPVCWSLMGYATGWCTAFFGRLAIAIEPECMGMGDENCAWKIQTPQMWGKEADEYLKVYSKIYQDK